GSAPHTVGHRSEPPPRPPVIAAAVNMTADAGGGEHTAAAWLLLNICKGDARSPAARTTSDEGWRTAAELVARVGDPVAEAEADEGESVAENACRMMEVLAHAFYEQVQHPDGESRPGATAAQYIMRAVAATTAALQGGGRPVPSGEAESRLVASERGEGVPPSLEATVLQNAVDAAVTRLRLHCDHAKE
ncbi:hypothetical protein CYMTET_36164, partial [Cymbomonas tetramitiformis]